MVTSSSEAGRSDPAYAFDFCGGQLAIDFTNTVGSRGGEPKEHLRTWGDAIAWAEARGILPRKGAQRLRRAAARHPSAARTALSDAIALREALYRTIAAAAASRPPAAADLALINRHLREALSRLRLVHHRRALALIAPDEGTRSIVDAVLTPVVRSAADLLTSTAMDRVRACADPGCAWLFLDTTRSGTRRWCTMKSCGNRSKVRRFRRAEE